MILLAKVIDQTDLPKGGFELIHCSRETGGELIVHEDIDVLSFTGSPDVGWKMKSQAGKKHTVLELGGNAAAIVAKDANLKLALDELLVGGFAYSGQVCIHTQRIYVHETLMDEFVKSYISGVEQLEIGDPMNKSTEFGVMIDETNAKRVESWVNEALENGAECLVGGSRVDSFYAPTVLTSVRKGLKVRDEEVFGPVVIIESFSSIDEAIAEINDCRWGLQAALFTDSIQVRNRVFNELNVGGVIHNKSTSFRVDDMPYGGVKDSGFGREGVRYAMLDFLEPKLLVKSN
jgi:glyceraldehyde-3-phosphate dehydrogenase (NADP+)